MECEQATVQSVLTKLNFYEQLDECIYMHPEIFKLEINDKIISLKNFLHVLNQNKIITYIYNKFKNILRNYDEMLSIINSDTVSSNFHDFHKKYEQLIFFLDINHYYDINEPFSIMEKNIIFIIETVEPNIKLYDDMRKQQEYYYYYYYYNICYTNIINQITVYNFYYMSYINLQKSDIKSISDTCNTEHTKSTNNTPRSIHESTSNSTPRSIHESTSNSTPRSIHESTSRTKYDISMFTINNYNDETKNIEDISETINTTEPDELDYDDTKNTVGTFETITTIVSYEPSSDENINTTVSYKPEYDTSMLTSIDKIEKTTVKIYKINNTMTRDEIINIIKNFGFYPDKDFNYINIFNILTLSKYKTGVINFVNNTIGELFINVFKKNKMRFKIQWAKIHGVEANIKLFKTKNIIHTVSQETSPILFDKESITYISNSINEKTLLEKITIQLINFDYSWNKDNIINFLKELNFYPEEHFNCIHIFYKPEKQRSSQLYKSKYKSGIINFINNETAERFIIEFNKSNSEYIKKIKWANVQGIDANIELFKNIKKASLINIPKNYHPIIFTNNTIKYIS
jgi:hypothetical protein